MKQAIRYQGIFREILLWVKPNIVKWSKLSYLRLQTSMTLSIIDQQCEAIRLTKVEIIAK